MAKDCWAEECPYWTGSGCVCEVAQLNPREGLLQLRRSGRIRGPLTGRELVGEAWDERAELTEG